MPLTAVGLVLASCGLHALWNLFVKQGRDKVAFTALFLLAVPVLFAPVFLALLPTHLPSTAGWLCVVATGIVYTAYFLGLARAYEVSDLSVAYPLSRGLGPALTVLWGVLLLGERPTERGWLGIALTLAGAWMLSWHQGQAVHWRSLFAPPLRPAWFVAAMYSAYSVIDKLAVSVFTVHPAVYIYAAYTVCAVLTIPIVLKRKGTAALWEEWQRSKWLCLATAVLNIAAYLLVLFALSLPHTPISYIIPLRTVGILFGVLLGTEVLGETGRWRKSLAALALMAGVALIVGA